MADASVKLSERFPDSSVLTDLLGQLKDNVGGVKAPGMPDGQIQGLTTGFNLQLPDTSNWHTAIPDDAKNLAKDFPSADTLTKPITEPIGKVSSLLSTDFVSQGAHILESFGSATTPGDPESLLSPFTTTVAATAKLLQDPELRSLLGAIADVTGSQAIRSIPDSGAKLGNSVSGALHDDVEPAVAAIVSFSALAAALSAVARLQIRVSGAASFSPEDTQKRLQAVIDAYSALAAQIGSGGAVDPSEAAAALQAFLSGLATEMAITEASLALLGTSEAEATFDQIQKRLATLDLQGLNGLAGKLTALIQAAGSRIKIDADLTMDKYMELARTGLGQVRAEVDKLDPSKLVSAIQGGFQTVLSPLKKLEDFKTQVETIVRGSFQTIDDAIKKIDLSPLKNTVQQALNTLEGVLKQLAATFQAVRTAIQSALDSVKSTLDSVKSFVLDPQNGLKKKIEDVFHSITGVLDELKIQDVVAEVTVTIQPISDALAKIEFGPIINAVLDAIGTITDVLKTVAPLLVTDALKQKLADATAFLKQIDFNKIADTLNQGFDQIMASVDQDALGAFKAEYNQVVQSLAKFDPAPALDEVQKEVFDPLLKDLEQIHPAEVLKPVQEGFDKAAGMLEKFDPASTFSFMTDFFTSLLAQIDSVSPAKMLEPVQKTLDDLRNQILTFLHIDDILTQLTKVKGFLQPILNAADLDPIFSHIQDGYTQMKSGVAAFDTNFIGTLIAQNSTSGVVLAIAALTSDSNDLTPRVAALQTQLNDANDRLSHLDAQGALTSLRGKYGEINAAISARTGGPLDAGVSASIQGLDPMPALAPLLPKIDRVKALMATKAGQFSQSAAKLLPTLQALGGTLPALRALLSPLTMLKEFLLEPVRKLFPGKTLPGFRDVAVEFLNELNPADLLGDVRAILTSALAKLKAVIDDAVLNPILDLLRSVKSAFDILNIHPLIDAINGLFQDLEGVVKQLDPTPIIQDITTKYKEIVALLESLNPAQFISEITDIYNNDIVGVVKAVSPRDLLLPPLKDLFAKISAALGAFDIQAIFKPVLDRLKTLDTELSDGLHKTGAAYDQMLAVLASAGGGSVSVSASASVGG
jgi:hypothetical protein